MFKTPSICVSYVSIKCDFGRTLLEFIFFFRTEAKCGLSLQTSRKWRGRQKDNSVSKTMYPASLTTWVGVLELKPKPDVEVHICNSSTPVGGDGSQWLKTFWGANQLATRRRHNGKQETLLQTRWKVRTKYSRLPSVLCLYAPHNHLHTHTLLNVTRIKFISIWD